MLNLFTEENRRNPFPLYDQARSASPILPVPELDLWMAFDYDSVKRVLNDFESFSSSMYNAGRGNPEWFFFFDPPRHTKLRALISRAFTSGMIASLEQRMRQLVADLLDAVADRGEMDMAADFAVPFPMMVITEMLGAPPSDLGRFQRWNDAMLNLSYSVTGGAEARQATDVFFAVTDEMSRYLEALLAERRAAPRPDLLTGLLQAEVVGDRLTHKEILGFFQLLLVAGTETTTNLLNNTILCWAEHPAELARLRANPGLLPLSIEEVLRFRSPFQWAFRATLRPVELHGQTIPAGKLVLPMMGSANRDPKHFSDPGRFDIGRDPNPHIAFGHGIHFCLGAPLSRLEAKVALGEFLARIESFELTGGAWQPRKGLHVHGPASLPMRFQACAKAMKKST